MGAAPVIGLLPNGQKFKKQERLFLNANSYYATG
jgi:hypothetical protein